MFIGFISTVSFRPALGRHDAQSADGAFSFTEHFFIQTAARKITAKYEDAPALTRRNESRAVLQTVTGVRSWRTKPIVG